MQDLKQPPRIPQRAGEVCAVNGCTREPRTWSRWCSMHARRVYVHRDPNGRTFTARELKPYKELTVEFVRRLEDHPTMRAGVAYMEGLLVSPALPQALRKEMTRLRDAGATGEEMLTAVLPVFLLMHFNARAIGTDMTATTNLGKRLLATKPMPQRKARKSGTGYSVWPRGTVLQAAGQLMRDNVGLFARSFATLIERACAEETRAATELRKAIEAAPLEDTLRARREHAE